MHNVNGDRDLDDFYYHQIFDLEDMAVEVLNDELFGKSNYRKYHMLSRDVPCGTRYKSENSIHSPYSCEWTYIPHIDKELVGKCDEASKLFVEWFNQFIKTDTGSYNWPIQPKIHIVHGEMSHNKYIDVNQWNTEHTMVTVKIGAMLYWVDCTQWQFSSFIEFDSIVGVYTHKPWWFYPDYRNPSFSKLGKMINKIKIKHNDIRYGLIEYFQYVVHRNICMKIQQRRRGYEKA